MGHVVQELPDDGQDDAGVERRGASTRSRGYVKIKYQAEDPDAQPAKAVLQRFSAPGLPAYAILKPAPLTRTFSARGRTETSTRPSRHTRLAVHVVSNRSIRLDDRVADTRRRHRRRARDRAAHQMPRVPQQPRRRDVIDDDGVEQAVVHDGVRRDAGAAAVLAAVGEDDEQRPDRAGHAVEIEGVGPARIPQELAEADREVRPLSRDGRAAAR